MIITDIEQINKMAEQMFGHNPNLVAIDINDSNRLKSSSSYLNATKIQMPSFLRDGLEQFEQAIKEFKPEGAHQILLQICGVSSQLAIEYIRLKEICLVLRVIESHFGKRNVSEKMTREMILSMYKELYENIDLVWGLSHPKTTETDGYEVNIVVGYK